jgi:CheY-like chemotaxis protein
VRSVLVVDDDRAMQQLMAYVLKHAGHQVWTAQNGQEALQLLRAQPGIRLIISDLDMPVLDGFALLRQLNLEGGPPVLIITARGQRNDDEWTGALGAAGVLEKPFSRQELIRAAAPFLGAP